MKNLRRLYAQNLVIQFLVSYILVLILPLLVLSCGFQSAFGIVERDIKDSHITMLKHSTGIIDNQLDAMETLALQTSKNSDILAFTEFQKGDMGYIQTAMDAIDNFYNLMSYQSIDLLDDAYIYFQGMDLVMYDSSYYQPRIFNKYLSSQGISFEEWKDITVASDRRIPEFQRMKKSLEYVMPFSGHLSGDNQGVIVFRLKREALKSILDFSKAGDGEAYAVQIYDRNNNWLWSSGTLDKLPEMKIEDFNPDGYSEKNGVGFVYTVSERTGWQYILAVPEKQALYQLSVLKNLVLLLMGIAIFAGAAISVYLAVRKGKPLNEVFKVIASSGKNAYDYRHLGEVVTGILKDHQELLEEIEKEKPSMKKAFFHDLIKAEFSSDDQLLIAAKKAGIQMTGTIYLTASFELFAGNDFYDVDEQTLDEVHIISWLMENYITESYPGVVWFYKENYRITMAIFALEQSDKIAKPVIHGAREWMLSEYQVETNWGIGNVCDDLLLLWKASEESRIALNHCSTEVPVVEYSAELENIYEFYFPDIAQEKLIYCVRSGNTEKAEDILAILEKENCMNRKLSRSQFIKLNRKVTDMMTGLLKQDASGKELLMWLNEMVLEPDAPREDYFRRLKQLCQRACMENIEKKRQQRGKLIEKIMAYMQEHYMDSSLGLAQVGTVFRVSEGYLSSLFKERSGINFADYLEGLRIDKACELLMNEKNTVNDIAQIVGYNSVQSFRRAFKRVKGISPKEARIKN